MPVSIYEWEKTVSGGDWIEVTSNKVINLILRELNNLIKINGNNEVYVDLQLDDNLQSSSPIPVGVNVWRVLQANGFPATWTLITAKTTSWDTVKVLYGDDGKIRVDNGTGTWEIIQYEMHAGVGISIDSETYDDYSAMRWPCPEWFHIPSRNESIIFQDVLSTFSLSEEDVSIPFAWDLWEASGSHYLAWSYGECRTCKTNIFQMQPREEQQAYSLEWTLTNKARWLSVRPFKDGVVIPTSDWDVMYDWSSVADWAWVFHNPALWLISLSPDWESWITMADKNLWATTMFVAWDAYSQENCGWFFQWGNNYMFPFTWATKTWPQVEVIGYWPWNYYYSDTFICNGSTKADWASNTWVETRNLRWWETGVVERTLHNVINNTWVLSVNWQTWHVVVWWIAWITRIKYENNGAWELVDGKLEDCTILVLENKTNVTKDVESIEDGEWTTLLEVEVIPERNIPSGGKATWLLKEDNWNRYIFPWLWRIQGRHWHRSAYPAQWCCHWSRSRTRCYRPRRPCRRYRSDPWQREQR